ncbi:hypothetical protein Gotur_016508 [Gossypium turneri]
MTSISQCHDETKPVCCITKRNPRGEDRSSNLQNRLRAPNDDDLKKDVLRKAHKQFICDEFRLLSDNERLMRDLWNHNYKGWNKERVNELFGCTNRDRICNLPIIANGPKDSRNFNKVWPQCGEKEETLIHALKDYPKPRAILTVCGLDNRLLEGDYSCYIDWIEDIMRALDMKVVADFFATLWNSWNSRNNFIFRGQDEDARTIWARAKTRDLNCSCGRVFGHISFIALQT